MIEAISTEQTPLFVLEQRPSTTSTRYVVDLACLACGRGQQLTVATLTELPPMPGRCKDCGGSVLATGFTQRLVRYEGPIDWNADRPRRGRPFAHPKPSVLTTKGQD